MHNLQITGNSLTINRGLWVRGPVYHANADYWHGAIDVLAYSLDPESGYDGGTIDGLVVSNNAIQFVNSLLMYPGEEPQSAVRLVRNFHAQNPVTVSGLVVQGNAVTDCPSPNPVVVGSGVSIPGAVIR
jgi:hypothetical protein